MHRLTKLAVLAAAIAAAPLAASARSSYLSAFNTKYGTSGTALNTCSLCHPNGNTGTFNAYATDLSAAGIATNANSAFTAVEPQDSDRDGFTNLVEIRALSFPGDSRSVPPPSAGAPKASVSASALAFGTVNVGSAAQQTTDVLNTGTADLTVSSVARCNGTSAEFAASPAGPFTVAPGGRQTVTVRYTPVDATTDTGCVQIAHDDRTTATLQVSVSAAGQAAPAPVVDVDITRFVVAKRADISRGATVAPKVAVVNAGTLAGTATVSIEGAVTDAAGAVQIVYTASQDVTLAPAAATKVSFPVYTPTAPATITWTVTVADGDPDTDVATAVTKIVP